MKLIRVAVTNYKLVEDSTPFKVDQVTCFVGKNESGKTSVLEALYKLNPHDKEDPRGKFDKLRDYPRRHYHDYDERHPDPDDPAVGLSTVWHLDDDDVNGLSEYLGPDGLDSREFAVKKKYNNRRVWDVKVNERNVVRHLVGSLPTAVAAAYSDLDSVDELKGALAEAKEPSEPEKALSALIESKYGDVHEAVRTMLAERLPRFVLFSHYDRMHGTVSIDDLNARKGSTPSRLESGHHVFLSFLEFVGVTVDEIAKMDKFEPLIAQLEATSIKISQEMFRYWTQNRHLKVQFRIDVGKNGDPPPLNSGNIVRTRIENTRHGVTVGFDERSAGFVWFFSFLVLFSQVRKKYGNRIVLLLDEPGLTLHAKAQGDLLRYFDERLRPNHQVLYTTHSPFMVPADQLLRARTVEDVHKTDADGNVEFLGTKVGDDVLSTDRETLFPLQAALGYEITQTLFVGKHTLLVEGPSDLVYIQAFSAELKSQGRKGLDPRWTVCPTGSIDKVTAFMTLFGGQKLHVAVVTDYATGGKKKVEELRQSELLKKGHVFTQDAYAGKPEADVEDVIGDSTYVDLVNKVYKITTNPIVVPSKQQRVVKYVEDDMKLRPSLPEFDHYTPAAALIVDAVLLRGLADINDCLARFEKLFADLNALLPSP